MKTSSLSLRLLLCCAALCGTAASLHAANFTTAVQQAGGATWLQGIWQPGAVGPVAGNTYEVVAGGNPSRIRNPTTGGVLTFPGDSLQLNTNTEIRGKIAGTALNFPGVGGNPGLILNGGNLDMGDNAVMGLTGIILVQNPSSITCGDSGGNNSRGWTIGGELRGSTNITVSKFFGGGVNAVELLGLNNPFTGNWIILSGGFKATGSGSLGDSRVFISPTNAVSYPTPFEVMYDVNSTGSLTITNGGTMVLHQNCTWSAVTINGTALTVGTHPYAELAANFPAVFVVAGSGSISVAAPAPPFAPLNISAVGGDTQVFLSWSPAINAAGYFINRSSTSGGPSYTTVGSSGTTNFTDTGLVNGTTNYYVIVATNNLGASTNSSEVVGIPNVVVVGIAAVGGTNQVTLNWTSLAEAASYSVLRATSPGGSFSVVSSGLATTTYLDTTAASGVTYYYRIAAVLTDGGQSGRSATVSATTAPGTPALNAALFASTVIRLGWTSPDTANRQFFLERSPDGTNFSLVAASSVNQLSYTNTGLTLSNTYYYRVQASNVTGLSAYSNITSNQTPVFGLNINFALGTAPIPPGYLKDIGDTFGDRTNGQFYGWITPGSSNTVPPYGTNVTIDARWRQNVISPDLRYDTFIHLMKANINDPSIGAIWEITVPNGPYIVHLVSGESDNADEILVFDVEGTISPIYNANGTAGAARWGDMLVNCAVTDGKLTIKSAPGAVNSKIAFVDIYPDIPIPPVFAVQPQSQNVEEWRPISLTPILSQGSPRLDYQWYSNNIPMEGATNRILNFPRIHQSDAADYFVIVTNYGGSATSDVATITVYPDVTIPTVVSVGSLDGNTVGITFSEEIDVNSGASQEASNYQIDGGNIAVLAVSFRPDGKSVKLTLAQQITSTVTLDVLSIPDYAGNSDVSSTNITPMGFTAGDVGEPALAGSNYTSDNDAVEVVGGGADIWGTMDQGYLATKTVSGNFDARIKVNSLRGANAITKAVLVARETGNSNSAAIHISLNPPAPGRDLIEMGLRPATDAATAGVGTTFTPANVPNGWMRIVRIGDQFSGYRSTNGVDWYVLGQTNVVFPAGMQIGFGITAHDNTLLATGTVSGFSVSQSFPDLAVTKVAAPEPVTVGGNVTYTITVTNMGSADAPGTVLSDVLPAGLSFVSVNSSQGSSGNVGNNVTATLGAIPSLGSATVTIVASATNAGSITNIAVASTTGLDGNPANNSATAVTTVNAGPSQQPIVNFGYTSGSGFSAAILTQNGVTYALQYKDDLSALTWQTLSTFLGDGTVKTFSDNPDPVLHPNRFYQIIVAP